MHGTLEDISHLQTSAASRDKVQAHSASTDGSKSKWNVIVSAHWAMYPSNMKGPHQGLLLIAQCQAD